MFQDLVITMCICAMIYALIPQLIHNYKNKVCEIPYQTSIITFISLTIISVCFLSLLLYFSFIIELIVATLWGVIVIQRYIYNKKSKGIWLETWGMR